MISLIICTYNRERYLPQLLQSILDQDFDFHDYEIVLINNNSPGNTEEIAQQFQQQHPSISFTYFLETQQGLSYARNRGIELSQFELVTFLDDDAFLHKDYLKEVIKTFASDAALAAVGGPIALHYEEIKPNWASKYIESLFGYYVPSNEAFTYDPKKLNNYPRGSNMSFKRAIFEKIGGFDTNLGRTGSNLAGGEEKELFQRIYAKSFKVTYQPLALVYHCVPKLRTELDYIKRQSIGVGFSERTRSKKSNSYSTSLFKEFGKWIATFGLCVIYFIKAQFSKGTMLIRFRWWITKGLLGSQQM